MMNSSVAISGPANHNTFIRHQQTSEQEISDF
jgi:hypothetical protein